MARNRQAVVEEVVARSEGGAGRLLDEVMGVLSLTVALYTLLSFVSFHWSPGSNNLGGRVGEELASLCIQALGIAAYGVPLLLCVVSILIFTANVHLMTLGRSVAAAGLVLSTAVMLGLALPDAAVTFAGGWIGGFTARLLDQGFGPYGSYLVAGTVLLLCFIFTTRISLGSLARITGRGVRKSAERAIELSERISIPSLPASLPRLPSFHKRTDSKSAHMNAEKPDEEELGSTERDATGRPGPVIVLTEVEPSVEPRSKRRRSMPLQQELRFEAEGHYHLPPVHFLDPPQRIANRVDEDALRKSSQILEAKLADFGIQARVVEVRPGPVITTFDIEPAPGVKVNRIVSLADDLAMALRVPGVRILAPVPGKPVVGIEVANPRREEVRLREMVESELFQQASSPLTLALGKDTAGLPVIGDLARMPHLLIAGATGSGKSVAINAMIVSMLYKALPSDLRFVMIDLKMLELSVYEDIPHLLVPVVTDPKKAVVVLKNIVEQMDERYRLLKARGVRSIDSYNRLIERERAERAAGVIELTELADESENGNEPVVQPPPCESLPKIVVIIDELADLMMTMGRHVEEPITRLAQKARAAGIHLILATQRPSVDVITGLIKANFPARISFQTTSRVDSRTILDHIGAERLLGGGDMLYMPPGTARLQRLHGPLVTEQEIHKIVDFLKKQGTPQYVFDLLESPDDEEPDAEYEEDLSDELYDQAVRLVTENRQASISWIQRRLRIGYNRAARIVERMEREGVVSPSEGGKPREVLAQRIDD